MNREPYGLRQIGSDVHKHRVALSLVLEEILKPIVYKSSPIVTNCL
ncbi:hypothetical protein FG05_35294 [Fusarium graminearum]|nr:hypothetical protein FG05_35294 [Fusarium graminearum]